MKIIWIHDTQTDILHSFTQAPIVVHVDFNDYGSRLMKTQNSAPQITLRQMIN